MCQSTIEEKKISIILPVYNGEKYLDEALTSIIEQTYTNFELIIIDDCSTDYTEEIAKKFMQNDSRVHFVKNVVNLKLPRTLNVGFSRATGDYLTWTSDDNKYKPSALERMVQYLNVHNDVDMVYTDYTEINTEGKITGERQLDEPDIIGFKNTIGACFLYRREVAEAVGEYDPGLFLAEDYDYWIRISKVGKIGHIHESLYFYRKHETSLTTCRYEQAVDQTFRVLEKHFLYLFSMMKNEKDRKAFLKSLEKWGRNLDKEQVRKEIYSIRPIYKVEATYHDIKHRVWKVACKIKKKLGLINGKIHNTH